MNRQHDPKLHLMHLDGEIQGVDSLNREILVSVDHSVVTLDIPLDCVIRLNGERVKLRLLQPCDPVHVAYRIHNDIKSATLVEVSSRGTG